MYTYVCQCICVYVCTCICMHVSLYVYIYIYIYCGRPESAPRPATLAARESTIRQSDGFYSAFQAKYRAGT